MSILIETRESAWRAVRAWAESELKQLRDDIERDLSEAETIAIRAEIRRLRELLGLPEALENGSRHIDPERFDRT